MQTTTAHLNIPVEGNPSYSLLQNGTQKLRKAQTTGLMRPKELSFLRHVSRRQPSPARGKRGY
jgi:hypothetical protein